MRKIVFDIETKNFFDTVPGNNPADLDLALISIYDSETGKYSTYLEEELKDLWPILERADMLIGFNSDHFDLPLLNKYYPGDLLHIKHVDILKEIKDAYGRRMRLGQLAEGTLNDGKNGEGANANKLWQDGKIQELRDYCVNDVRLTKELYDYALKHNKLLFKEGGQLNEVKLDTSKWEEKGDHSMTFSMGF